MKISSMAKRTSRLFWEIIFRRQPNPFSCASKPRILRSQCSVQKLGEASDAIKSSLKKISQAGKGVILYLRQSQHNLDLIHQLQTYAVMRKENLDFQTARKKTGYGSYRDYGIGAQILNDLDVKKIRLLTNHPPKVNAIEAFDLEIVDVEPL